MEVWRTALNEDEHYSFAIPIALGQPKTRLQRRFPSSGKSRD